jgi:hypothetical protein
MAHPSNGLWQRRLSEWSVLAPQRLYLWGYGADFGSYLQSWPIWDHLGGDIQYWHQHGGVGMFMEGAYQTPSGDLQALKDYVVGRMMWDPVGNDPHQLTAEFLAGYYQPAAQAVRAYMDGFAAAAKNANCRVGEKLGAAEPYLSPSALLTAGSALNAGQARTSNGTTARKRLDAVRLSLYMVVLQRWDRLKLFARNATEHLIWPFEPTKAAA